MYIFFLKYNSYISLDLFPDKTYAENCWKKNIEWNMVYNKEYQQPVVLLL